MAKILCLGQMVSDVLVKPVDESVFSSDTIMIDGLSYASGGDAMNQAIVLSRLGDEVKIAGMLGDDETAEKIRKELKQNNVDCTLIQKHNKKSTATSIILCQENGERHIIYYPGANEDFFLDDFNVLDGIDLVSIGSIFGARKMDEGGYKALLCEARQRGIKTAADMTANMFKLSLEKIYEMLPHIDYFCPSYAEGFEITKKDNPADMIRALWDLGCHAVVLKCGAEGCYLGDEKEKNIITIPAYSGINVIDTTGAGDNFTAGFLHAIMKGFGLAESAKFACATGAIAVGEKGAHTAIKDETQVLAFMEKAQ